MKSLILLVALAFSQLWGATTLTTKTDVLKPNAAAGTAISVTSDLTVTGVAKSLGQPLKLKTDNILLNEGFEYVTYDANWTYSGSGTKTEETSLVVEGASAVKIVTSANGFSLSQSSTTNATSLAGMQGVVWASVKTTSSTVYVCSLVNGSEVDCLLVSPDTIYTEYVIPVVMGSTSTGVVVRDTSSTATTYIDKTNVGVMPAGMMPDIAQAQLAGESYILATTSCQWTRSSTTVGAFSTVAACPGPTIVKSNLGTWSTTDTDLPQQVISNLPAGDYEATFIVPTEMSAAVGSALAINDGTTTCKQVRGQDNTSSISITVSCTFSYTESGTRTFSVYGASDSGTIRIQNQNTTSGASLKFILKYFPPSNKIYANQDYFYLDTSIGGASFTHASSGTQVGVTNASLDMVINPNSTTTARIPCSTTVAASGLTCSSGSESLGINFVAPTSGVYEVCASFTANGGTATYRFVETGNSDQTIAQQGTGLAAWGGTNNAPIYWCDRFKLTQGEKTIRIFQESAATIQIEIDRSVNAYLRDLHLTVRKVNSQIVGTFKDVVTTPSVSGGKPIVFSLSYGTTNATTNCSSSPCSYLDQIGSEVTSVTRASTGLYTLNLASTYAKLKCGLGGLLTGGTDAARFTTPLQCSTCSTLVFTTANQAGTVADTAGTIVCHGYK